MSPQLVPEYKNVSMHALAVQTYSILDVRDNRIDATGVMATAYCINLKATCSVLTRPNKQSDSS